MTGHKCKQLEHSDFLAGLNWFLAHSPDDEYRAIILQAIKKPQNWQAEAKVGLCRMRDGGNK